MTIESITQALKPVVAEWPIGSYVWHRANGKRGVVFGYLLMSDLGIRIQVDYGSKTEFEPRCLLSGTKVSEGGEGDEWKDDDGREDAAQ